MRCEYCLIVMCFTMCLVIVSWFRHADVETVKCAATSPKICVFGREGCMSEVYMMNSVGERLPSQETPILN